MILKSFSIYNVFNLCNLVYFMNEVTISNCLGMAAPWSPREEKGHLLTQLGKGSIKFSRIVGKNNDIVGKYTGILGKYSGTLGK